MKNEAKSSVPLKTLITLIVNARRFENNPMKLDI